MHRLAAVAQLGYCSSDTVHQQFTHKERDVENGLDYFLARYYSSLQGRFTSPDEFKGGPEELFGEVDPHDPLFYSDTAEPQSLNKYQYCLNNPLRYIDPDGHQTATADALKIGATLTVAAPHPVAKVIRVGILVGVGVEVTIGWKNVGDKFVEVFSGSGSGCAAGGVVCGPSETPNSPVQYQRNSSSDTNAQQGQQGQTQNSGQTAEKTKNLADAEKKGIPKDQLGPSGKPKVHAVNHPTKKRAEDAARAAGQGKPAKDTRPKRAGRTFTQPIRMALGKKESRMSIMNFARGLLSRFGR